MQSKSLSLLNKSREATILAVEVYNKPSASFKSYNYIVLMTIAWTSLLHAIFEKHKVKYYYRKKDGKRYDYVDGEKKAWDLSKCLKEYYKNNASPERKNVEFVIELRNKIEHRFLPALDYKIIGECQALLLNYEKLLTDEFGEKYSLTENISIPLQLLTVNPAWKDKVLKELQTREYEAVSEFIGIYRAALSDEIWRSQAYSFQVYLIPKVANRATAGDISIEFIKYDPNSPEQMEKYEQLVSFIKDRKVEIPVPNKGYYSPSKIAKKISHELGINFTTSNHTRCWKHYKVRPKNGDPNPAKTNQKYCHLDDVHNDYVYTPEWVDFLLEEMKDLPTRLNVIGK